MKQQRIPGFFDSLLCTPAFLFLCAMFLCGAMAGGLTGLHASDGDNALQLADLIAALPEQAGKSVLCAALWVCLPIVCALLRPAELFLSGIAAAKGFVLAMTAAVALSSEGSLLLSLCAAGIPATLSVPALLAACAMVWQSGETSGRYSLRACRAPYGVCIALAVVSALLRTFLTAMLDL